MAATKKLAGKRKRQEFSEQDKFFHKSAVLLQREAKKMRAFEVRKLVQQLKQTRAQLAAAEQLKQLEQPNADTAAAKKLADKLAKKAKQLQKMQLTVTRLEKELEVLKALELKAVVARAVDKTGLEKKKQQEQLKKRAEQEKQQRENAQAALSDDEEDDDMRQRRLLADESDDGASDDDGFDSEDCEQQQQQDDGSETETEPDRNDEDADEYTGDAADTVATEAAGDAAVEETKHKTESTTEDSMQNVLIDRILAHKQLRPLLDAIEKVIEKQEREEDKKLRKQEKKALKRDHIEVLIGGRSAAAPSSLFLGSLSGRGGVIDDDDGATMTMGGARMDGADDDIAEFLGETKKKKNRMGQNARRQKAIRMEEAAKRKADRENGIFRPFAPRSDDKSKASKYGPSKRPKKSKKQAADAQAKGKAPAERRSSAKPRGPAAAAAAVVRAPPPAPVEPSHPSWIAKQALKEKEKASLAAFSGKKITFGDD